MQQRMSHRFTAVLLLLAVVSVSADDHDASARSSVVVSGGFQEVATSTTATGPTGTVTATVTAAVPSAMPSYVGESDLDVEAIGGSGSISHSSGLMRKEPATADDRAGTSVGMAANAPLMRKETSGSISSMTKVDSSNSAPLMRKEAAPVKAITPSAPSSATLMRKETVESAVRVEKGGSSDLMRRETDESKARADFAACMKSSGSTCVGRECCCFIASFAAPSSLMGFTIGDRHGPLRLDVGSSESKNTARSISQGETASFALAEGAQMQVMAQAMEKEEQHKDGSVVAADLTCAAGHVRYIKAEWSWQFLAKEFVLSLSASHVVKAQEVLLAV